MKKTTLIFSLVLAGAAFNSTAGISIDYEGLDKERTARDAQQERIEGVSPDGYRVLTDKGVGVVYELGARPEEFEPMSSQGSDVHLKEALAMVMPSAWVAYIDSGAPHDLKVSWAATDAPWIEALDSIGTNLDVRFIVDWDASSVLIKSNSNFEIAADPTLYDDPESGKRIYVFSSDSPVEGMKKDPTAEGVVIKGDEAVRVRIVN